MSNSQPSHKNDYNLDDDAYEATNQFVGARVSGKTCDVDNVTALACDHVRQESLLWTNDFFSANDYQCSDCFLFMIPIVVSIMSKDDDLKSDRNFAKIALIVQKWASTFTSKVFTILMNVEK